MNMQKEVSNTSMLYRKLILFLLLLLHPSLILTPLFLLSLFPWTMAEHHYSIYIISFIVSHRLTEIIWPWIDKFAEIVQGSNAHTCIIIDSLNVLLNTYPANDVLQFLHSCHVLVLQSEVRIYLLSL